MAATTDISISERMLEVLKKIDEKLERLDRQLRVGQPCEQSQPTQQDQHHDYREDEQSLPECRTHSRFRPVVHSKKMAEIELDIDSELRHFLNKLSCPCPHITDSEKDPEYLFYKLITLCSTMEDLMWEKYKIPLSLEYGSIDMEHEWPKSLETEYLGLLEDVFLSLKLGYSVLDDIRELIARLSACDDSGHYRDRDIIKKTGLARFDQLPGLFTPGTLLMSQGRPGREQYAAVSMCELVSGYSESDIYRVDYWHFRWTEKGLCRVCESFEIQQYTGKRHISQLIWRPLIDRLSAEPIREAVERGKRSLAVLRSFPVADEGDYPLLMYDGSLARDEKDTVS
jgi:hypothetical protein